MTKKQTDIIIANPIYDVVFKNLMTTSKGTNKDIARYFFGAILGEEITDIEFLPQEYTYHKPKSKKNTKSKNEVLTVIRLDFVATIRTKNGEFKKVLIEIQKSHKPHDLLRFRTYLGEQYKQKDMITVKDNRIEKAIPIVIIYMLGFELSGINTIIVKVPRQYIDLICNGVIDERHPFIESLTHDGYFIQIPRINRNTFVDWENCSDLIKILSLFEQDNFIDNEAKTIKRYTYSITDKNLKKMVETLEFIAADPKIRRAMQEEYWAAQDEIMWEKGYVALKRENAAQAKEIARLRRQLGLNGANVKKKTSRLAKYEE